MSIVNAEILVIEDDHNQRKLFQKILENAGVYVHFASDLSLALEIIKSVPLNFIISETEVSGERTIELIRRLKTIDRYKNIPVLIVSSQKASRYREKSLEAGAADYLEKPLNANYILQVLRKFERDSHIDDYILKNPEKINFELQGDIIKLNEFSCILRSSTKFGKNLELNIKSDLLTKLGLDKNAPKIARPSMASENGQFDSILNFVGVSDDSAKKVRSFRPAT